VLVVDDEPTVREVVANYLRRDGHDVAETADGAEALAMVERETFDLVVLDMMLPGVNGLDILRRIRQLGDLPVIMLTARGEESDRILGLMHGADDYLPKPFNPLELSARVKAVLKRSGSPKHESDKITAGPLELNLKRRELTCNRRAVALTAAELRVMEQLLRHPDEVLSRARLTELSLKRSLSAYDRSIDTLVSKLRSKLAASGISRDCIRSLRGPGYVLDSEVLGAAE